MHCLTSGVGQFFKQWPNELIESQAVNEITGKPKKFQAEAIMGGVAVLSNKASLGQRMKQAMSAALREARLAGDLSQPHAVTAFSQDTDDLQATQQCPS